MYGIDKQKYINSGPWSPCIFVLHIFTTSVFTIVVQHRFKTSTMLLKFNQRLSDNHFAKIPDRTKCTFGFGPFDNYTVCYVCFMFNCSLFYNSS